MHQEPVVGVVVGTTALGDYNAIIRLLTENRGMLALVAKGVRSKKPRFAGFFDLGTEVSLHVQKGKGRLDNIKAGSVLRTPIQARNSLLRLAYLSYACEISAALVQEEDDSSKFFKLLQSLLSVLEGSAEPTIATRLAFEAKVLTFSGLRPHLVRCGRCDRPLDSHLHFSHHHGGVLHRSCGEGTPVTLSAVESLETLRRTPLSETPTILGPQGVSGLLLAFLQHHIGRAIKSYPWVAEVEALNRLGAQG